MRSNKVETSSLDIPVYNILYTVMIDPKTHDTRAETQGKKSQKLREQAPQVQMDKRIFIGNYSCKLWFVFLVAILLCLFVLDIDYSSMVGTKFDIKLLVNNYVNAFLENKINVTIKNFNGQQTISSDVDLCLGRYIYIHDLPSQFNNDVLKNCHLLNRNPYEFRMCQYTVNLGLGPQIANSSGVLSSTNWFSTNQFFLEVIFHNRLKKYECLTNDSSLASAIFVPYCAGLHHMPYFWGFNTSMRDAPGLSLLKWVAEKPEWRKMWGRDHFLIGGRISNDFRRKSDKNSAWGCKFRAFPESQNMSMLSIESSPWSNDLAIPYPTSFHPVKDNEVLEWQDRMRKQKRQYLLSFSGAPRSRKWSIRGYIIDQCLASNSSCKLLDCRHGKTDCDNPVNVVKVLQSSVFCLQPPGDSYTRRSIFESLLAGCIPVFFHPGSAYAQYTWHLPKNHSSYSVYIPEKNLRDKRFRIKETLLRFTKSEEEAMREEVIRLIPRIIYAKRKLETLEDAFDIAVKRILERIETFRKDPSIGFAVRDDSKFYQL